MAVLLETATLPKQDRAEAFYAAMMSASVPSRVEHEDRYGDVHARMDFWRLGAPDLFRNEGSGIRLVRTPKHVRIGAPERLALAVQVIGTGLFSQGGTDQRVQTGELMLVDLTAPYDFAWSGQGASQAFQIDYADLGLSVEVVRQAARRLQSSPLYELVLHQLTMLPTVSDSLHGTPAADALGAATTQLVRALLLSAEGEGQRHSTMADVLFTRILWYARRHVADPSLSPAGIAAEHNISLRYLYKLFAQHQLSLEQWLIGERLDGARRQLASLESQHRSVASVAAQWGFLDPGHFARRFRRAYGMTPQEWRRLQEHQ
ncbi:AraC family transcriptional regulator [Kribbella albertanoniae]|uniref:Helix-turn-helix domain-containing protein n=1 Tax=Kribbella albertanoniae TaxID=1266829 RepID=A0A4R4P1R7_9ACTN|nr:helix-turn-helix domain-containing protein [Kribbella albertanoniae]TDC14507.1 helix-turn-helix domain-containing protein [Kribbella albertanoniae]